MRMKWTQLLLRLVVSFFLFLFSLSIDFHCKKKGLCYHFIDDVCVRVCAEAGVKDSFFFCA